MRIGILETGPVSSDLAKEHGAYPQMFEKWLGSQDPSFSFQSWCIFQGEMPEHVSEMDGWLITGSKFGVYESHEWIPPLEEFLRQCLQAKIPVAGVCFGHQILAQAMGARVEKSEKGWGLGVSRYELADQPSFLKGPDSGFSAIAVHQDQVLSVPENATVVARSEFCPIAALTYGDPDRPQAISVQPHPEFNAEFVTDLIEVRRDAVFPSEGCDRALETINEPTNSVEWARWIADFYKSALLSE